MGDVEKRVALTSTMAECLRSVRRQQKLRDTPSLLQLVVRWRRDDICRVVLSDQELLEQRQPAQVQRAFQDALEQSAMLGGAFDTSLVETLIDFGADAPAVFLQQLFGVRGDSFKFLEEIEQG